MPLRTYFWHMSKWLSEDEVSIAKKLLAESSRIVITTHKSPDGDAIGSSLGLYHILRGLGKPVHVILPDEAPEFLHWMEGFSDVLVFSDKKEEAAREIAAADLIFSLDYNHLYRTGEGVEKELRASEAAFILIDHHQQPEAFAEVTYSDTKACSTAEMIYRFAQQMELMAHLNAAAAECIYCGIMTDSGSFRFPNVSPDTHHIAASLIETGLDHARVHREVYDTNLHDRLRLIGYALNEKLEVIPECATALIALTQDELKRFNYRPGDTEGLVNQALSIRGIKLAAFFREGSNEIKVSFRSKGTFDVNQFARGSWNGGGHMNASGGSTQETMEEAVKRFRKEAAQHAEHIMHS